MIKLIASDMDGTLLNSKKGIGEYTLEQIKTAMNHGVRFVIASGRAYDSILPVLKEFNLECACITGNGAQYIDEEGKLISAKYLDPSTCCDVIDLMKEHNIHFIIYTTDGYYGIEHRDVVAYEFALRGLNRFGRARGQSFEEVFENIKHHGAYLLEKIDDYRTFLQDKEIIKIEAFDKDEQRIVNFKPLLAKIPGIAYLSSYPDNTEVTNANATKGLILKEAAKYYGIQEDEVLVFGDGMNDLSMFTEFPQGGVAMANAEEDLKKVARYITTSYDEEGVGLGIKKYVNDPIK